MIIYIEPSFEEEQKNAILNAAGKDTVLFRKDLTDAGRQLEAIRNAEIIFGNPRPPEILNEASNMRWLQFYSTGFEAYKNIRTSAVVTNLQDFYSEPCAETMVGGILALFRGMDRFGVLKAEKQWVGHPIRNSLRLLERKKVLILGWGNIGKRVARLLSGFNCEILIFSRSAPEAHARSGEELKKLIPFSDIIIGTLPGTAETRGLFTVEMLGLMHPEAIFCNVGRGNLLEDESALVKALREGRIGGAVLDVTLNEPLPPDDPLWDCPNTILSQHSGGGNVKEFEEMVNVFLMNLERYRKGEQLLNQVDLSRGY